MFGLKNKNFRKRSRWSSLTFVSLIFVSLILFFTWGGNRSLLDNIRTPIEGVGATISSVISRPIEGIETVSDNFNDLRRAHKENDRLKKELAQLRDVEMRANALAIKMSRFESILNVDVSSGIPEQKVASRAVSEVNGPFVHSILLNVGSSKNIQKGHAVMTSNGMLGHVIRVGKNSSRVLKLEDLNSRIAVMSVRSQARAILTGNNTAYPTLSFVRDNADWQDGDIVVTSGDAGVLPAALPIGRVTISDNNAMVVELNVKDEDIDWVWVYPYEPVKPPSDIEAANDIIPEEDVSALIIESDG